MYTQPMMQGSRAYLLDALGRLLDGGELEPGEPRAAIADAEGLPRHEKDAWEHLELWAGEAEVRARDANYARFLLDWLRDLRARLAR
jgi:hypothetical protein